MYWCNRISPNSLLIFYINIIPFLHRKLPKIIVLTAVNCTSNSAEKITKELNTVNRMYNERVFNIDVSPGKNKFNQNALRDNIRPAS